MALPLFPSVCFTTLYFRTLPLSDNHRYPRYPVLRSSSVVYNFDLSFRLDDGLYESTITLRFPSYYLASHWHVLVSALPDDL